MIISMIGQLIYFEYRLHQQKTYYESQIESLKNKALKEQSERDLQAKKEIYRKESPKQQDFD